MSIWKNIKNDFMKLNPVGDRVLIRPDKAEEKTKSGIIIPATLADPPMRGEVIAVGPGVDGNMMTVQKGDYVLYGRYSGQEIEYNEKKYVIMHENEVLIIVD